MAAFNVPGYKIIEKIAEGSFGSVYKARRKKRRKGKTYAIKVIDIAKVQKETALIAKQSEQEIKSKINTEISLHKSLNHSNIVKFHAYGQCNDAKDTWYIVMEYIEGQTLLDYLTDKTNNDEPCDDESTIKMYFKQILDALVHCHEKGIAHRDIKLENIMITKDKKKVVLVDFGLSKKIPSTGLCKTKCGSMGYAPPEIYTSNSEYPAVMVDVYSLGIVLYAMCFLKIPFAMDSYSCLYETLKVPNTVSLNLQRLIKDMLKKSPLDRIPLQQIYQRSWLLLSQQEWCTSRCTKECPHTQTTPRRNSWIRTRGLDLSDFADSPRFTSKNLKVRSKTPRRSKKSKKKKESSKSKSRTKKIKK